MFQKFNELFNALNKEALRRCDEDLTELENSQIALLCAWLHYVKDRDLSLSRTEYAQIERAKSIISRF